MSESAALAPCPCGTGRPFDECCGPIIGGAPAPTAEALMRSRYTAVTLKNLDHLDATHAPEVREDFNRGHAEVMASEATWLGLEIKTTVGGGPDDDTGTVEFLARYKHRGAQYIHHERATFRREDGRWVYIDGQINPKQPPRRVTKVGRNDPCHCGSGRKYKKCCGAAAA